MPLTWAENLKAEVEYWKDATRIAREQRDEWRRRFELAMRVWEREQSSMREEGREP